MYSTSGKLSRGWKKKSIWCRLYDYCRSSLGGDEVMAKMVHNFRWSIYISYPPEQRITNVIAPLPKKGNLSLMINYRGITLMSNSAKVYNKILLSRIRDHVDRNILRRNHAGVRPGKSCAQRFHMLRRIIEAFESQQHPLTFIDFKKVFDSINRNVMFAVLRHYGIYRSHSQWNQCTLQ